MCTCLVLAIGLSAFAGNDAVKSEKAEQYTRAASNYEAASKARVETAEALLTLSRELRKQEHANEKALSASLRKAGYYERQAGELLYAACLGYDRAAAAWAKAAKESGSGDGQTGSELLRSAATAARDAGTAACERSAEAYECSAEAFSDVNSGQMAISAEEAARMREALARRIK